MRRRTNDLDWMRRSGEVCRSGTASAGGSGESSPGVGYRPRADDGMSCRCMPGEIISRAERDGRKTYTLSFSSEAPCSGWLMDEVLVHTAEAVDLSRLRTTGTLLFHHGFEAAVGSMPIG